MRVAFRTDASTTIGSGHVVRCLTLADALRKEGADVLFVSCEHDGNLCAAAEARGVAVARLQPIGGPVEDRPGYADWLGAGWSEDAKATQQAIRSRWFEGADWLVVDHYAIGEAWEQMLRGSASKILVIDDLADRYHDCDLLLDQNLVADYQSRYRGLLPPHVTPLLGPSYALLHPRYAELKPSARPRKHPVRRMLVYFGAADHGLTGLAVSGFLSLGRADIALDVVVGAAGRANADIESLARQHPNITLHRPRSTLAELMLSADFAIGAAGATSWERICLMLPSLVVTLADNQIPVAKELSRLNQIRLLGRREDATKEAITEALQSLLSHSCGVNTQWLAVDGAGVNRVCKAIFRASK